MSTQYWMAARDPGAAYQPEKLRSWLKADPAYDADLDSVFLIHGECTLEVTLLDPAQVEEGRGETYGLTIMVEARRSGFGAPEDYQACANTLRAFCEAHDLLAFDEYDPSDFKEPRDVFE